jgi:hypothetical protein
MGPAANPITPTKNPPEGSQHTTKSGILRPTEIQPRTQMRGEDGQTLLQFAVRALSAGIPRAVQDESRRCTGLG